MRYLILAHVDDPAAWLVHRRLEAAGYERQVRLVSVEELVHARRWSHSLDQERVSTDLVLPDGTSIVSSELRGVFNRLRGVVMPRFASARSEDRQYAVMEMHSLLLSWLASLPCPVINRPTPNGLAGACRHPLAWLSLAAQAGVPIPHIRVSSSRRRVPHAGLVPLEAPAPCGSASPGPIWLGSHLGGGRCSALVVGDRICGAAPQDLAPSCLRLARLAGTSLLRIDFQSTANGEPAPWVAIGADPLPELADDEAVGALVDLLTSQQEGSG